MNYGKRCTSSIRGVERGTYQRAASGRPKNSDCLSPKNTELDADWLSLSYLLICTFLIYPFFLTLFFISHLKFLSQLRYGRNIKIIIIPNHNDPISLNLNLGGSVKCKSFINHEFSSQLKLKLYFFAKETRYGKIWPNTNLV